MGKSPFLGFGDDISLSHIRQRNHVNKNFFCEKRAKKDFCGLRPRGDVDRLSETKSVPIKPQMKNKLLRFKSLI